MDGGVQVSGVNFVEAGTVVNGYILHLAVSEARVFLFSRCFAHLDLFLDLLELERKFVSLVPDLLYQLINLLFFAKGLSEDLIKVSVLLFFLLDYVGSVPDDRNIRHLFFLDQVPDFQTQFKSVHHWHVDIRDHDSTSLEVWVADRAFVVECVDSDLPV